jgi:hypothetical protein
VEVDVPDDFGARLDRAVERRLEVFEDESVGLEDVIGLAGVFPPSFGAEGSDGATVVDEVLKGVGDLEFAPFGGFDPLDSVEHFGREQEDASQDEVRLRSSGFLDDPDDVAGLVEGGDAELFGIVHLPEEQTCGVLARLEALDDVRQRLVEDVVTEVDDEVVVADEIAGTADRVGQPQRSTLEDVRDVDAERGAVTEKRLDRVAASVPQDDRDLRDPRLAHVFDGVLENGFVGDRDELFRSSVGDRPQARPAPAAEYDSFHRVPGP